MVTKNNIWIWRGISPHNCPAPKFKCTRVVIITLPMIKDKRIIITLPMIKDKSIIIILPMIKYKDILNLHCQYSKIKA